MLNFWHVSKLNKELGYIKRNGLHPNIINVANTQGTNDLLVSEGNSIITSFYTAFRIFLKSIFDGAETFKSRDIEEWKITYRKSDYLLDNESYLLLNYNSDNLRTNNGNSLLRTYYRAGYNSYDDVYHLRLSSQNKLHAKEIFEKLSELEERAKGSVDAAIGTSLKSLSNKIIKDLGIEQEAVTEKPIKKVAKGNAPIATNNTDEVNQTILLLRRLLPCYAELKSFLGMFNDRAKFSYILNFAKADMGRYGDLSELIDNEENYRRFADLTNNFRL